ncbi:hypothetical protein BGZ83_008781 [Gryganskiella cystojenkinii]|nr:hypothetical protein BGZ83_008781 [Gryganskiella cystojenkinii]
MNTSNPYDYQQQQQQQQAYGARRQSSANALSAQKTSPPPGSKFPTSISSSNLAVPAGRPLPKTPPGHQQQQQQYNLDPTNNNSSSSHLQAGPHQMNSSTSSTSLSVPNTALASRGNIHISQPSTSSLATTATSSSSWSDGNNNGNNNSHGTNTGPALGNGTKSNHGYGGNARNYSSWVQPKPTPGTSTTSTAYSTGSAVLGGMKSQQHLNQQHQPNLPTGMSPDEASAYHAALTRPISPTMIMNYVPPPTSNIAASANSTTTTTATSSAPLRPASVTSALSSSFNTLGPGSQPSQRPTMAQGAKSSYINTNAGATAHTSATPHLPPPQQQYQPVRQNQANNTISSFGGQSSITPEDPGSNASKFPRRGPLVMSQETSSPGDPTGTRSRRESTYSDTDSLPPFSPAMIQSGEVSGSASPASAGTLGMQLQTWKRCYAIGRYRGDAHPGLLTLFKDNEHLFPIKTIDMSECYEVQVKAFDTKGAGRFEFKLVTRKEETWFATDTMSERTGWIDALNSLMAKVVGASLLKLEAKLNTIRHRNNSLEYAHTALSTEKATLEEHLQLVQQDLVSRENQLTQREQELERKRVESLLVQLEAWRAAAKVTVNQHYAVRDQLLERVMKTARTVQELTDRAKVHLETGSDQVTEVVKSHMECLRVHMGELGLNGASQKMIKSIVLGLTVNLDTRSSEIKRVLLVLDQYIAATKSSSSSSPTSPRLLGSPAMTKEQRRMSIGATIQPPHPPSTTAGINVYILQLRDKYTETLLILEENSKRLKRILERSDLNNMASGRRFYDEVCETLRGLLNLPSYPFMPCLPDQPLPGAADTFYREDLVQIQQKGQELLRKASGSGGNNAMEPMHPPAQSTETQDSKSPEGATTSAIRTRSSTPEVASIPKGVTSPSQPAVVQPPKSSSTGNGPPTLSLALPESLSSFLFPEHQQHPVTTTNNTTAGPASTSDLTQKLRDTILPEFDHLSIKQEESLQSMTALLNQVSSVLVNKLGEIKDATHNQRQEFEELKDEIIDVMQLSATDPSAHQRDISALSEIRSKLAEITGQLENVQSTQAQLQQQPQLQGLLSQNRTGSYRRLNGGHAGSGNGATATGLSLLQRSASTMVHSSTGVSGPAYYHTIDSGSRGQFQRTANNSSNLHPLSPSAVGFQIPNSSSMINGGGLATGKHSKIAGMARMFEEKSQHQAMMDSGMVANGYDEDENLQFFHSSSQQVVSKLDQLLLLLEFVNTAQCRMMAYQDLQYDKSREPNVDDGRMIAVQEHMEQMDRKMNQQMHLLRRIVTLQGVESRSTSAVVTNTEDAEGEANISEIPETDVDKSDPVPDSELPEDNELTLVEVLNRLDFQVIPSVQDQSNRIYELSDQLSEMKRQLDEQQRRHQDTATGSPLSRPRVATALARGNSIEGPAPPLTHSRSTSQISVNQHQQQQQVSSPSAVSSPLEVESPALWRASLRPSSSTGSSGSVFGGTLLKDRSSSQMLALQSTSDRITEMLDRMDARMTSVIDEQLTRYEKGNKELLAKVFELLEADEDDDEEETSPLGPAVVKRSGSASLAPKRTSVTSQEQMNGNEESAVLNWPTEPFDRLKDLIVQEADRSENSLNDQRDEILERMNNLQSSIQDAQASDSSREGTIKEELQEMRDWIVTHSSRQTEHLRELMSEMAMQPASKTFHVADPSFTNMESLDDGPATTDSSALTKSAPPAVAMDETLIREVIKDQLEMFTRIQMATFSEMSDNLTGVERMMRDMAKMMGLRRGGTIMRKKEADEGRAMLAMEVKETIEEVMTRRISALSSANSPASLVNHPPLPRGGSLDSGVDRPLDTSGPDSSNQEVAQNMNGMRRGENSSGSGSGIFKYLYQPRRSMSLFTGMEPSTSSATSPTTATGKAAAKSTLALESDRTLPRRSCGELAFAEEDEEEDPAEASHENGDGRDGRPSRGSKSSASTTDTTRVENSTTLGSESPGGLTMDWLHDQLESLYRRKARTELEVEGLTAKKESLKNECDALQQELEELRAQRAAIIQ